jgi:hypothetical protein
VDLVVEFGVVKVQIGHETQGCYDDVFNLGCRLECLRATTMRWGLPNSAGHYLDLASAVLGVALTPPRFECRR